MTDVLTLPTESTITTSSKLVKLDATKKHPGHVLTTFQRQFNTADGEALVEFEPVFAPKLVTPPPPPPPVGVIPPVNVGSEVFRDNFTAPEKWGVNWIDYWFAPGNKMNGTTIKPENVLWVPATATEDAHVALMVGSDGSGSLMSTNPHGGDNPGFVIGYGYTEFDAWFDGLAWAAIWGDGQTWPQMGEPDIAEWLGSSTTSKTPRGGLSSNYHSGGPSGGSTDVPDNSGTIPGNWTDGRHRYGMDRQRGLNVIYWDGKEVRRYNTYDGGSPQYLLLTNGVGLPGSALKVYNAVSYNPAG